jgi:hypothetical protein
MQFRSGTAQGEVIEQEPVTSAAAVGKVERVAYVCFGPTTNCCHKPI